MFQNKIEQLALNAMIKELILKDKPGLVEKDDSGSHEDMSYHTMTSSILSLRGYFSSAFDAGLNNRDFNYIRNLGKHYERKMLRATCGVNTHKGVVFQLGILIYLIGRLCHRGEFNLAKGINEEIEFLNLKTLLKENRFGARRELISGYSLSFDAIKIKDHKKRLFYIMSKNHDTNILRRGGVVALKEIKRLSKLAINGDDKIYEYIIKNRLSPGGSADILINSIFIEDYIQFISKFRAELPKKILEEKESMAYISNYKDIIIASLIFPGLIKDFPLARAKFDKLDDLIRKRYGVKLIYKKMDELGMRAIYRHDFSRKKLIAMKKEMIALEEMGLIDVDIYDYEMIDRKSLSIKQRRCLVCEKPAKTCMIENNHTKEEILSSAFFTLESMNYD